MYKGKRQAKKHTQEERLIILEKNVIRLSMKVNMLLKALEMTKEEASKDDKN